MNSPNPLSSNLVEHELNQLDAKIRDLELALEGLSATGEHDQSDKKTQLQLALVELKRQRNSRFPISRLPADAIVHIFDLTREDWENYEWCLASSPPEPPSREAMVIQLKVMTHVYSAWRQTALSVSTLWTDIIFRDHSPTYVAEILQRSGRAPISVSFLPNEELDHAHDAPFLELLQTQMHRIRSLYIKPPTDWTHKNLGSELAVDGKGILEILCLPLPANAHDQLWEGGISLQLLQYSSDTLRFLSGSVGSFATEDFTGVITFPKLARISLQGFIDETLPFLSKLSIPPTCTFALECWDQGEKYARLIPFLQGFCKERIEAGQTWQHLQFSQPESLFDSTNLTISVGPSQDEVADIYLKCEVDRPDEHSVLSTEITKGILSCSVLLQLTTLSFTNGQEKALSLDLWTFLSQECINVHSIFIHAFGFSPLCQALAIPDRHQAPNSSSSISSTPSHPFPSLKKLELSRTWLDQDECEIFYRALTSRCRVGITLRELVTYDVQFWSRGDHRAYLDCLRMQVGRMTQYVSRK